MTGTAITTSTVVRQDDVWGFLNTAEYNIRVLTSYFSLHVVAVI